MNHTIIQLPWLREEYCLKENGLAWLQPGDRRGQNKVVSKSSWTGGAGAEVRVATLIHSIIRDRRSGGRQCQLFGQRPSLT